MAKINLNLIKNKAEKDVEKAGNLKELDIIYKRYLGKKGEITQILRSLKDLSEKERKERGKTANQIKKEIEKAIADKKEKFQVFPTTSGQVPTASGFDITAPGKRPETGHLHPLALTKRKIEEIFRAMGFSVVSGPEIETEFYNFDALNIPQDHPARDLWDTFWLQSNQKISNDKFQISKNFQKSGSKIKRLLLRTHTSPVQIRYMEKNNPPFRIIAPGRVYRREATDVSHEFDIYQVEGLMLGKDVSVANFKAVIEEFLSRFFRKAVKIRLRPSFFPFVEPGFEVDVSCVVCGGNGCGVCSKTGWLELMGAGMVHPNVLKAGGINPKNWQGFAFGFGMDRLAMLKYKIDDIRLFRSGDLRFLKQF